MDQRIPLTPRRWITACFLGWLAGIFLVILTSGTFDAIGLEGYQFYLGLSMGLSVGVLQWRLLHRTHGIGSGWLIASIVGVAVPFLLFDLLKKYGGMTTGPEALQYSTALGGAAAALWQTLILRREGFSASRWLFAGWSGWVLGTATVLAIDYTKYLSSNNLVLFALNLLLMIAGGAVYGAVTAVPLIKILSSKRGAAEE
ncbi:MAG: hypothetical protein HUU02_00560 [Bacteroidetes bacterium]|nr:hypothetical protein [Bacteroidota bacterium]